jgi:hypothetical protein
VDIFAINRATERFWNLIRGRVIVLADRTSRFYKEIDRGTDQIDCSFLFLDAEAEQRLPTGWLHNCADGSIHCRK